MSETKNPVYAEPLPPAFQTAAFSKSMAAAEARAAAVPAGSTLISQITEDEWLAPDNGTSIVAGALRAG